MAGAAYWFVKNGKDTITFQKKKYELGYFKDYDKAVSARKDAEERLFKPMLEKYGRVYNG